MVRIPSLIVDDYAWSTHLMHSFMALLDRCKHLLPFSLDIGSISMQLGF